MRACGSRLGKAILKSESDQAMTVNNSELMIDRGQVIAESAFTDTEATGNRFTGFAAIAGNKGNNLLLPSGE